MNGIHSTFYGACLFTSLRLIDFGIFDAGSKTLKYRYMVLFKETLAAKFLPVHKMMYAQPSG